MSTLLNGDCREILPKLTDGAFDLILTDPPYGIIKGMNLRTWNDSTASWDEALDPRLIFDQAVRLLRPCGRLVLFAQEPYTTSLLTSPAGYMEFNQRAVWMKGRAASCLGSRNSLVSSYEDILIFTRKKYNPDLECALRNYFRKLISFCGGRDILRKAFGGKVDHMLRTESSQFDIPSESVYSSIVEKFGINRMDGFLSYGKIYELNHENIPTFNLPEGRKSRENVFEYAKPAPSESVHPTQKPVPLLRELIRIYSNPGGRVLDFTMGSGSTGCACIEEDREFYGIERDPRFFEIARGRCEKAEISRRSRLF